MGTTGPRRHGRKTRIALVHPTYWPEVRRGSERVIHDLAAYLTDRGFEATVLTGHRGRPQTRREDGFRVVRSWRPPARLQPRGFEPYANHAPLALAGIARRRFDLLHVFHVPDAAAAGLWARLRRIPLVLSLMGFPDRQSLSAFRGRARLLRFAAARASAVHVLSEAAGAALQEAAAIQAITIHPGTRTEAFRVAVPRTEAPVIFCAASARDPRKRVAELVDAFGVLRQTRPEARLRITGPLPARGRERFQAPGVDQMSAWIDQEELVRAYASSWVTVLPSGREAFGQVLVESLAAGTPVVAVRDGAAPEIVDDGRVGVLCEGADPDSLAAGMRTGLELAEMDGTADACRQHAARWDWSRIGPRFESLYERVLGRK